MTTPEIKDFLLEREGWAIERPPDGFWVALDLKSGLEASGHTEASALLKLYLEVIASEGGER